jgi:hypothetical protein
MTKPSAAMNLGNKIRAVKRASLGSKTKDSETQAAVSKLVGKIRAVRTERTNRSSWHND